MSKNKNQTVSSANPVVDALIDATTTQEKKMETTTKTIREKFLALTQGFKYTPEQTKERTETVVIKTIAQATDWLEAKANSIGNCDVQNEIIRRAEVAKRNKGKVEKSPLKAKAIKVLKTVAKYTLKGAAIVTETPVYVFIKAKAVAMKAWAGIKAAYAWVKGLFSKKADVVQAV